MKNTNIHSPGEQKTYLPTEGNQLRYFLYLPPKFSDLPDRSWPVICFLHGIGEAAKSSDGADQSIEVLLNHGAPPWHCEINSPLIQDFIVLSPQLPTRRSWEERGLGEVSKILKALYKSFHDNRDKSYLTGFSICNLQLDRVFHTGEAARILALVRLVSRVSHDFYTVH